MRSWKLGKSIIIFCCGLGAIYNSPHFFSRFCISEFRFLSNKSIVEQTAQWLIEREHPNAELHDGGIFDKYMLLEHGEFVLQFNIGKMELLSPLFSDYANHVYVHAGGSYFFIFDSCETMVAARS